MNQPTATAERAKACLSLMVQLQKSPLGAESVQLGHAFVDSVSELLAAILTPEDIASIAGVQP